MGLIREKLENDPAFSRNYLTFSPIVNFTIILRVAFVPIFFPKKIKVKLYVEKICENNFCIKKSFSDPKSVITQ